METGSTHSKTTPRILKFVAPVVQRNQFIKLRSTDLLPRKTLTQRIMCKQLPSLRHLLLRRLQAHLFFASIFRVLEYPIGEPGAVTVTWGDKKRLNDEEFLNDTLIEYGLK